MNTYLTKRRKGSQSQSIPLPGGDVATVVTEPDRYVLLCDWHGRVVWKSGSGDRVHVGDELWQQVVGKSRDALKAAVGSVVTLHESRLVEVDNERGERFRLWLWPLLDPESAICILAMKIPSELSRLTDRETACLRCLAKGHSTRDIADELEIGVTTVHTHLRRSREKLKLSSGEELIGFAARYFFEPAAGRDGEAPGRKRSG